MSIEKYPCLFAMLLLVWCSAEVSRAQIATVTDASCTVVSGVNCLGPDENCHRVAFTVPKTGTYTLTASIDDWEKLARCERCLTEVYISSQAGSYDYCTHNECDASCAPFSTSVTLTANTGYVLYCCKVDCDGDCDDCPQNCTSRATVE